MHSTPRNRLCWMRFSRAGASRNVFVGWYQGLSREFVADPFRDSMAISKVVMFGPSLD